MKSTVNIVIAGLGGQGVVKASDVLSEAVFRAGYEVKKSELHGMSQRGGSVCSDVRFGTRVLSPMVPPGQADYLLVLAADQVEVNRTQLRADGVLIEPKDVNPEKLVHPKSLNIALLGVLSAHLDIGEDEWFAAIRNCFSEKHHASNERAFAMGRETAAMKHRVL